MEVCTLCCKKTDSPMTAGLDALSYCPYCAPAILAVEDAVEALQAALGLSINDKTHEEVALHSMPAMAPLVAYFIKRPA